jgi:hypothetical protein
VFVRTTRRGVARAARPDIKPLPDIQKMYDVLVLDDNIMRTATATAKATWQMTRSGQLSDFRFHFRSEISCERLCHRSPDSPWSRSVSLRLRWLR